MTDADLGQRILRGFEGLRRARSERAAHDGALRDMRAQLQSAGMQADHLTWNPETASVATSSFGKPHTWPSVDDFAREARGRHEANQRIIELCKMLKEMGADPDLLNP